MEISPQQKQTAITLLRSTEGGCVWWRVGTGKTRIAYFFFAMIAKQICKRPSNFLVVCRREAFDDWKDEAKKMGLADWQVFSMDSELDILCKDMIQPPFSSVILVSHGMLAKLLPLILEYSAIIQGVAFDEGYLYKNSQTKHSKAAHKLSKQIGRALILSGSVMTARNLEDVYGQLYAINRQQPIGRTLTHFRTLYRIEFKIGSTERTIAANRKGSARTIRKAISDRCSFYFPANNQRRIVESIRSIQPTKDQLKAFASLRENMWLDIGDQELIIKNAPTLIIKCQQISDGFISITKTSLSPSQKPITTLTPVASAKLDYLVVQVTELLTAGEKVVIWCAFRQSVRLVLQRLQREFRNSSIGIYSLLGGTKFNRNGWLKDGQICVGTEASGSSVNFLKNCSYAIYYSMDCRWLSLQQSQGRTNRKDSEHHTCYYNFLQTRQSLDEHVYKLVRTSSREEQKLIMLEGVQSWLTQNV